MQVSCIHPLGPGDENYAISVAIPVNAPGVKLYARRPYALERDERRSTIRCPAASTKRTASSCSTTCFVPWERVFIYRDLELCLDQWWKTPSHVYGNHQAQARYATKLRFLLGLAKRMNEATGNDAAPPVQVAMGELAAYASIVENMLRSHETVATIDAGRHPVAVAAPRSTRSWRCKSEINPHMIDIVRELTGAAMIMLPVFFRRTSTTRSRRRTSSGISHRQPIGARERVALMRLAWDFIGTEFGSRHQQYEKFYGGASFLVKTNMYRAYPLRSGGRIRRCRLKFAAARVLTRPLTP